MTSAIKVSLENNGKWQFADYDDRCAILDCGHDPNDIKRRLQNLKPMVDWESGIVCLVDVYKNPIGMWLKNTRAYAVPVETDRFISDIFDASLSKTIVAVDDEHGSIYLAASPSGTSNITVDVIEMLDSTLSKPIVAWIEQLGMQDEWSKTTS